MLCHALFLISLSLTGPGGHMVLVTAPVPFFEITTMEERRRKFEKFSSMARKDPLLLIQC
jgi:hypothetical protein